MPVGRRFHYQIGGKGFMLTRAEPGGRSWFRTGRADTPGQRSATDAQFGMLPDELDHPEVWNDWSGGFGHAYREVGANTYHWAENFDARFPRQLVHCQAPQRLTGSPGIISDANWFMDAISDYPTAGGGVVVVAGQRGIPVLAPDPTGSIFEPISHGFALGKDFGRPALYASNYYFPHAGGTWVLDTPLLMESNGTSNLQAFGFINVDNRLWKWSGESGINFQHSYIVRNIADPAYAGIRSEANWSATINVGNFNSPIRSAVSLDGQLFLGASDGLYAGDQSGTFMNVLGELGNQSHPDNCRDLAVHNGGVVVPHISGLYYYQPSMYQANIRQINPPQMRSAPVQGTFRAVRSFGGQLYAGVFTGTASYLMSWRDGIWHSLNRLPNITRIGRIHFDGISIASSGVYIPNRIWIGTDASIGGGNTGTGPTYYWPIPNMNGNPLAPSPAFSANYVGSARIDLGSIDWDAPATPKIFRSIELWSEKLASGALWCNVFYDVDQSGSFTQLGTIAKSPKDTLYFPTGEGSFVTGYSIELSLRSFTATAALTPVYRTVIARGALQPRSIDLITAVTRIADNMVDMQGGQMRSAATMLTELRDFANPDAQGLQAHQLIDLSGATMWAKVLTPIEEHEVYQEGELNPEVAATVKMAVLTYS